MKYQLQAVLLFIALFMLISCTANERVYYKGNVTCTASNRNSKEWVYYRIELGDTTDNFIAQPVMMVRLKNGIEFRTDKITVENIENLINCEYDIFVFDSTPPFSSWPESAKSINCSNFIKFVINDNRICQIKLMHQVEFRPIGARKWYSLPCKESDIIEVFGEPDKFYEWFRE